MRGDPARDREEEEAATRRDAPSAVSCHCLAGDRHHHLQSQQMDICRLQLQVPSAAVSSAHADSHSGGLRPDQAAGDLPQRGRRAGPDPQRKM